MMIVLVVAIVEHKPLDGVYEANDGSEEDEDGYLRVCFDCSLE